MQNPNFIALLIIATSVAVWFSSSTQNKLADLVRAGILDSAQLPFAKMGSAGALCGFLFCVFSGTTEPLLVQTSLIVLCASAACLGMVFMLAFNARVDGQMAKALLRQHELNQAAIPTTMQNPAELQTYLDRAYGKGRVNAEELLAARRARREGSTIIH